MQFIVSVFILFCFAKCSCPSRWKTTCLSDQHMGARVARAHNPLLLSFICERCYTMKFFHDFIRWRSLSNQIFLMKMNRESETGLSGMGHTLLHKRFCLMSLLWIINLSIDSLYDRIDRSIGGSTVHFMSNDKSGSHHLIIIFEWSAECVQSSISHFKIVIYSFEATDDNTTECVCVCALAATKMKFHQQQQRISFVKAIPHFISFRFHCVRYACVSEALTDSHNHRHICIRIFNLWINRNWIDTVWYALMFDSKHDFVDWNKNIAPGVCVARPKTPIGGAILTVTMCIVYVYTFLHVYTLPFPIPTDTHTQVVTELKTFRKKLSQYYVDWVMRWSFTIAKTGR